MGKVRRIIVAIISVLYLILIIKKVDISKSTFTLFMGVILINEAIEEWNRYLETDKKIHLFIPIATIGVIIFLIVQLI
ncbi:hypothetical protein [uncultured Anaerococcus sp.]|uniref:hypothetical protein n=1 Tax=uncultured Anaerococcus sp. TaxID=293428 RepID=UPI0026291044|nr:hypothetical protein [uncultured Anaerococcus sp.]